MPSDTRIVRVELVEKRPIMFYRPNAPGTSSFLRVVLTQGGGSTAVKRAATAVSKALSGGGSPALQAAGWSWGAATLFEHEVALMQRFLTDANVSGGAVSVAGNVAMPSRKTRHLSSSS